MLTSRLAIYGLIGLGCPIQGCPVNLTYSKDNNTE